METPSPATPEAADLPSSSAPAAAPSTQQAPPPSPGSAPDIDRRTASTTMAARAVTTTASETGPATPVTATPITAASVETTSVETTSVETSSGGTAAVDTAAVETVILEPRYWVPLGVSLLGPLLLPLVPLWSPARWLALLLVAFGGFLLLQSAWLRLVFEPEALVVRRQDQEIRRFPYGDWSHWTVFWPPVPILFYFREVRSIHFLPMLFDATALRQQLKQRVPLG